MNLITEIQYFPPVTFYRTLTPETHIVFEQYETYQKMSFRNRTMIAGANGIILLSIPLETGREQKKLIRDVRIDASKKWQMEHWRSIGSAYNRSPWFDHYRDELEGLYQKKYEFLFDWNLACFEWTLRKLGLRTTVSLTEDYYPDYNSDGHIDSRNALLPRNYLDQDLVKYRQVFEDRIGFLPNLSILDLLFCEGKHAMELLAS